MEIDIHTLASSIANSMRPAMPVSVSFWGKKEIAACLSCSVSTVEKLTMRPDFPASYRIPSGKGSASPRWAAKDILNWMENFRGKDAI